MAIPADDEPVREEAAPPNHNDLHVNVNRGNCGCRWGAIRGRLGRLEERRVRNCLRIWEPLADQGDPEAQFYLGFMNEHGQGVARNDVESIRWYHKAADQDEALAQSRLGDLYASGDGSPPNEREAAQWYRLAADQGLRGAQFNLGMMYAKGKGVPQDRVLAHMWLRQPLKR